MLIRQFRRLFQTVRMSIEEQIATPPVCREMQELDRSFFTKKFRIWSLFLKDVNDMKFFLPACKQDLLQIPTVPFIVRSKVDFQCLGNKSNKLLLLTDKLTKVEDADKILSPSILELIKKYDAELKPYELVIGYDHWKTDEILRAILPVDLDEDVPSGFTRTGHIAHINLKAEYKPYDKLIGQVILDKNKSIRTVVDKVDSIATEFRTFPMKVIAGEEDFIVTQSESECQFKFDFSKVYWNSRLHTEHKRLIDSFTSDELICDVTAGVGPFAIPSGKKHNIVFANDLNPDSYKWLNENIKINKVGNFVKSFNMDGAEFIKSSLKLLEDYSSKEQFVQITSNQKKKKMEKKDSSTKKEIPKFFSQYIMNLPDSGIKFLAAFVGLYSNLGFTREQLKLIPNFKLPTINLHHFEKFEHTESPTDEELYHRMHEKVKKLIKFDILFEELSFHLVRKVSPTKPMFCISFVLPDEVAFTGPCL